MVLKNKSNNRKRILKARDASNDSKKGNTGEKLKRKIKGIASIALIMAELGMPTPAASLAESPIFPLAIETYHEMERMERYGDLDVLQECYGEENTYTYEERHFVNLLEDGAIFVLNTRKIDGDPQLLITRVDEVIMPGTNTEITEKNDGVTRIVYGTLKGFGENNIAIPSGYQKCICLDYIQDIDETKVGDFDYVQISPRYNTNGYESKDFYTKEEYHRVMEVVHELTKNIKDDDNDFVKMAKIYLAVIDHLCYDYESMEADHARDSRCGNLLSLCYETGVCAGYADVIYNLARYKGVKCSGAYGFTPGEKSVGHAWNVFYYTDKYGQEYAYGLDATNGDTTRNKLINNFATKGFELSHSKLYSEGYTLLEFWDFDPSPKSNAGFESEFIGEFLKLVENDINIRPETLKEMQQMRCNT